MTVSMLAVGCGGEDDASDNSPLTGTDAGGTGGTAAGGTGGTMVPDGPRPPLPAATGTCPAFANGMATFTVGGQAREAKIWIDDAAAAASDGPLVFYWYGTGGQPDQAQSGFGTEGIARITAAGGIVVAPVHVPNGVFPWLATGAEDFALTDEIIACAEQVVGIDELHIHSLGFSAGALHTGALSFARSSYLASVATYSGGGAAVNVQDPNNKFAAMAFHGGTGDVVVIQFQQQTQAYFDALKQAGHFAAICDHGGGHSIPEAARPNVVQFFFDHPFGTNPSPYAGGLPAGFPTYCTL